MSVYSLNTVQFPNQGKMAAALAVPAYYELWGHLTIANVRILPFFLSFLIPVTVRSRTRTRWLSSLVIHDTTINQSISQSVERPSKSVETRDAWNTLWLALAVFSFLSVKELLIDRLVRVLYYFSHSQNKQNVRHRHCG